MSWIKNFNSYRSDYLLKEELTAEQGLSTSKAPTEQKSHEEIIRRVVYMLDQGSTNDGFGTDEKKIIEAIKQISSFDIYKAVNALLAKTNINKGSHGYNSIQELLNGELGLYDLETCKKIKMHLNTVDVIMEFKELNAVSIVENSIVLTPKPAFQPSQHDPRSQSPTISPPAAATSPAPISCAKYRDPKIEDNNVKLLQQKLKDLGFYEGEIDGKYGNTTLGAVKKFQLQHKISPALGCYGPKTAEKMKEVSGDYIPFKGDTKKAEKGTPPKVQNNEGGDKTKSQANQEEISIMPETYWKTQSGDNPSSNETTQA